MPYQTKLSENQWVTSFTFIHIVFKPSPSGVYLSIIECEWSLSRKFWEDEVIELSLELQGTTKYCTITNILRGYTERIY